MPNRYYGFWQDKAMTQVFDHKRATLNTTNYDRAIKAMIKKDPSLLDVSHPTLAHCMFDVDRIVP
jgi:hypothetical protein